jgi:hypothetical protein
VLPPEVVVFDELLLDDFPPQADNNAIAEIRTNNWEYLIKPPQCEKHFGEFNPLKN